MHAGALVIMSLLMGTVMWLKMMDSTAVPETESGPQIEDQPEATDEEPESLADTFTERFQAMSGCTGEQLHRKVAILQQVSDGYQLDYENLESHFEVSHKTIKRDIQALREWNLIEFTGAPKNGYYIFTKYGEKIMHMLTP
jgi:hypothetical protein